MMKKFLKPLLAGLLLLILLLPALVSCGGKNDPAETDPREIAEAAERLLSAFETVRSSSLDGSYSLHSSISDTIEYLNVGTVVGNGAISGGSLSFDLTLSGMRGVGDGAGECVELYSLENGEVEHRMPSEHQDLVLAKKPLGELLPLCETAEDIQAALTLLPLLKEECDSLLSSLGVAYGSADLYAFFARQAALYRSFLLKVGQGQILFVPPYEGDAAKVLAEYGEVTLSEDGDSFYCFHLPLRLHFSALFDRLVLLLEMPIGEMLDHLVGEGTAATLLSEIAVTKAGETLDELACRIEDRLMIERGMLSRYLEAALYLADASEVFDAIKALCDEDAIDVLRMLSGDLSLSPSGAAELLSAQLRLTPDELIASLGRTGDLAARLGGIAKTLSDSSLSISFPCKTSDRLVLTVSYLFSGETENGYSSKNFTFTLTLDFHE